MKTHLALFAAVMCLASQPVAAQMFSWDPLKVSGTKFFKDADLI
jgi:hypothetical protein